jgi:hypothetical protein
LEVEAAAGVVEDILGTPLCALRIGFLEFRFGFERVSTRPVFPCLEEGCTDECGELGLFWIVDELKSCRSILANSAPKYAGRSSHRFSPQV